MLEDFQNTWSKTMSDFIPFYTCDECGEPVDAKDITAIGFPQKFFCPNCVYDFVEQDGNGS